MSRPLADVSGVMTLFASLCPNPPRAPHFIVTLYGDVVEPRGGALWMGSLIEVCARHGLSESLVRTAVSRLVASGRLEGERRGRRSYYRLSNAARKEFAEASRILFAPPPAPTGWRIALLGADAEEPRGPWVRVGNGAALAPETGTDYPGAVVMRAAEPSGDLRALAQGLWPLEEVAASYRAMLATFTPLDGRDAGEEALALRLRLVDDYRRAALADPRLPLDALPEDWPAAAARRLFVKLYLALSDAASRQIPQLCESEDGPLPALSEASQTREAGLRREAETL